MGGSCTKVVNFKISFVNEDGIIVTDEAVSRDGTVAVPPPATNGGSAPATSENNNNARGDLQEMRAQLQQAATANSMLQAQDGGIPGSRPLPPGIF
jgi:hypothetical protein